MKTMNFHDRDNTRQVVELFIVVFSKKQTNVFFYIYDSICKSLQNSKVLIVIIMIIM